MSAFLILGVGILLGCVIAEVLDFLDHHNHRLALTVGWGVLVLSAIYIVRSAL